MMVLQRVRAWVRQRALVRVHRELARMYVRGLIDRASYLQEVEVANRSFEEASRA